LTRSVIYTNTPPMQPELRTLRAQVEARRRHKPELTFKQTILRTDIIDMAEHLLATHGHGRITARQMADAIGITPATLRRYFADLDVLLAEILHRHLRYLVKQLTAVPMDVPDRRRAFCIAYMAATRLPLGGMIEAHTLLLRDRHRLPPDLLEDLENSYRSIGMIVGGNMGCEVMDQLDRPYLSPANLGAMMEFIAVLEAARDAPLTPEDFLPPPAPVASHHPYGFSDTMDPDVAEQLENGNLTWLRPAGLGSCEQEHAERYGPTLRARNIPYSAHPP
jgi:AcrR family transcriptional regulator